MITANNIQSAPLYMALTELKSLKDLRVQYIKERNDALAGKGLCAGMSIAECNRIARDLDEHIDSTTEAINILMERVHEIIGSIGNY